MLTFNNTVLKTRRVLCYSNKFAGNKMGMAQTAESG